jgi:phosphopantothenoylcysteine decarboxylase/phosphopantothenate--cysteine ligase
MSALKDIRVLITAGPTYEPIDPVRFIGNYSTGKMGIAIAESFAENGAWVDLVIGPSSLSTAHQNIRRIDVMTAEEMYNVCTNLYPDCKIAILAAAVADYKVKNRSGKKIKKAENPGEELSLTLIKNKDILAELGKMKKGNQVLGGFSLETHDEQKFAKEKLSNKNCDFIVMNSLNDKGAGFGLDTNKISIITRDAVWDLPLKSKKEAATDIVNFVKERYFR